MNTRMHIKTKNNRLSHIDQRNQYTSRHDQLILDRSTISIMNSGGQ